MGSETGLKDKYHSPKARVITDAAKAWVVSLACTKPTEQGYAAETWSHRLLAQHTRQDAPRAGHDCLKNAAKAMIQRILKEYPTQPHKVRNYTENRDPEFNQKMHSILVVYHQVNVQNEQLTSGQELRTLVAGEQAASESTMFWDGKDDQGHNLASGIYMYRLEAGAGSIAIARDTNTDRSLRVTGQWRCPTATRLLPKFSKTT